MACAESEANNLNLKQERNKNILETRLPLKNKTIQPQVNFPGSYEKGVYSAVQPFYFKRKVTLVFLTTIGFLPVDTYVSQ